ncbi:MAG TPA: threonine--tRNA ligase [Candidatus Absconditabacterales bacterium]|nr:threonine--tRNA ligase [Candidatus Absconditabacterales bacterium]
MEESILKPRHSLSHVLAQAVQRSLDPAARLGIGPAIDTGFYYDFIFSEGVELKEENLKEINKTMTKIVKESQIFHRIELNYEQAKEIITMLGEAFKIELIDEFKAEGETIFSYYINTIPASAKDALLKGSKPEYMSKYEKINTYIDSLNLQNLTFNIENSFITFIDMCEGPHVENTKEINPDAFKIDKIAGAYWRGNEKNPMMTRIYGLAFEDKNALKAYIEMMEEAKKRDHRVIGAKQKLFTISPLVGAGLPMLQPNGMIIRKEIENYLRELHKDKGYQRVWTPHLCKHDLYIKSGHINKYGDNLFKVKGREEEFFMKPMNCPHHMQIFADNQFSYRDMPVRYFEPATVYRDEKTGELGGLLRVRAITQDDGHLFCRASQIEEEVSTIVEIIKSFFTTMGMMDNYRVSLSVRGEDRSKYLGSDDVREKAEGGLEKAAIANNLPFKKILGEAAFYGPKLDFMFKDCLGRERQLSTIQCDFNLPERFELDFTNEKGEKERPVVIHRAISGSLERFMGVMIEHFAGAFPLWLSPQQIKIIPVADPFIDYANEVNENMKKQGLRASIDMSDDTFSKKIRNAEVMKIPYIVIVGEKEETTKTLSIREYKSKKQYESPITEFIEKCINEVKTRAL